MMESPPLFDTNETKLDDLEDDDEDIFASAVQVFVREIDRRRESKLGRIYNLVEFVPRAMLRALARTIRICSMTRDHFFHTCINEGENCELSKLY